MYRKKVSDGDSRVAQVSVLWSAAYPSMFTRAVLKVDVVYGHEHLSFTVANQATFKRLGPQENKFDIFRLSL